MTAGDLGGCRGDDDALLGPLLMEAPAGFALLDGDLRYRRVNRVLAEANGTDVEEHLGRRPRDVLAPDIAARVEATLTRVLETGEPVLDDHFSVGTAGTRRRHWQGRWFPARDPAGRVVGVAVLLIDVTERRLAEEALRRSETRTQRLQQATSLLATAMTVDEVAEVVTSIGREEIGADWTAVALLEPGGVRLVGGSGEPSALSAYLPAAAHRAAGGSLPPSEIVTPTTEAMRRRGIFHAASPQELLRALPQPWIETFVATSRERAWTAVPLLTSDGPLGALRFSFGHERDLAPEEAVFLEALAGQCALAVERSRLYEREHRTASALQRGLLPQRLPQVPGLDLAARYVPGIDEVQVGGDWYDVFPLPEGRVALVVGDVMGKGVTAAAGMGRMRSALRALAFTDPSPASVLEGLDRLVVATEAPEHIVTVMMAVADPRSGALTVSSAGHPPLLCRPADGGASYIDTGRVATPLGVPQARCETVVRLGPGDTVLAFSDGLVETRRRSLGEGLEELVGVADAAPSGWLGAMLDEVLAGMAARERPSDDVTVLAVRWTPADLAARASGVAT